MAESSELEWYPIWRFDAWMAGLGSYEEIERDISEGKYWPWMPGLKLKGATDD